MPEGSSQFNIQSISAENPKTSKPDVEGALAQAEQGNLEQLLYIIEQQPRELDLEERENVIATILAKIDVSNPESVNAIASLLYDPEILTKDQIDRIIAKAATLEMTPKTFNKLCFIMDITVELYKQGNHIDSFLNIFENNIEKIKGQPAQQEVYYSLLGCIDNEEYSNEQCTRIGKMILKLDDMKQFLDGRQTKGYMINDLNRKLVARGARSVSYLE